MLIKNGKRSLLTVLAVLFLSSLLVFYIHAEDIPSMNGCLSQAEVLEAVAEFRVNVYDQNGSITGVITIDPGVLSDDQIDWLVGFVNENGLEGLEAMIKEELFGMSQEEIASGEQCTVVEESSSHELTPQEIAELDIEVEPFAVVMSNGSFSKTSVTSKSLILTNDIWTSQIYVCEYIALVTINFTKQNEQITAITGTSFSTQSMNSDYGFENVRIPQYIGVNGATCGATANYDVYRWVELKLIPVKFSKNTTDAVIAYANDY